jgi:hypothetical protein
MNTISAIKRGVFNLVTALIVLSPFLIVGGFVALAFAMAAHDRYRTDHTHGELGFQGIATGEKTLRLLKQGDVFEVNLVETAGKRKPHAGDFYSVFLYRPSEDVRQAELEVCPASGHFCYRIDAARNPALVERLKQQRTIGEDDRQRAIEVAENTYKD